MFSHETTPHDAPQRSRWRVSLGVCVVLCFALHERARGQDAIALREQAMLAPGQSLTLGDVAVVAGPNAAQLAALPLRQDGEAMPTSLTLDEVRDMLARVHKQNMGRLALSGSRVRVQVRAPEAAAPPAPAATTATATPAGPSLPTIRAHVLASLAAHAGVPAETQAEALRAEFAPRDEGMLSRAVLPGQVVSVVPTGNSSEVPLQVRVYQGDTLVVSETLRAKVSVRRSVLVATKDVLRGAAIDDSNARLDDRWLPMSNIAGNAQALSAMPEDGAVAKLALRAGQLVGGRHIALPLLVEKGDIVSVDCVRDGLVVRASLRATQDGRLHDVIELEPLSANRGTRDRTAARRDPPTVRARVVGAGRAVMTIASESGETRVATLEDAR
jgi:flagella basal body P-ring formation protein FlgA